MIRKLKDSRKLVGEYVSATLFWIRLMLDSCCLAGILYIFVQLFLQLTPLLTVWLWKFIVDELERITLGKMVGYRIWLLIGIYLAVSCVRSLLSSAASMLEGVVYRRSRFQMNRIIMEKLSAMDASWFADPANADILDAAISSEIYFAKCLPTQVQQVTGIVAFAATLFSFLAYYPLGGILFLLTFIPGAVNSYRYHKKMDQYSRDNVPQERRRGYLKSILTTSRYARDVRLYHLKPYILDQYNTVRDKVRSERAKMFRENTVISFLLSLLTYSGIIAVTVFSVIAVFYGKMSIGTLILYTGLAASAGSMFQELVSGISWMITADLKEFERYMAFMAYENQEQSGSLIPETSSPQIEFRDVYFKYPGSEEYALNGLSFRMERGQKVALLGVNGAGKSTVVKLLLRFYEPEKGEILLNGEDIRKYDVKELYRLFSVCLQNAVVYAMSLQENIAFSDIARMEDEDAVKQAAAQTGMDELAAELPGGYETQMTRDFYRSGYQCSGGQKQKLALSRTFFKNASFIILDEPSSALDPVAEDRLFSSFQDVCRDRGGILISHRLSGIMMVDEILLMDHGRVIESGTHRELMEKDGEYARMYRMQADKYKKEGA
ncbi:MAG: ABC transporter ATP-binding protein/permease [Lachnospiraceae bacterium]|nr:ABC transporter ATP-binding protein/permease [Lachnospiraceae bacterium]